MTPVELIIFLIFMVIGFAAGWLASQIVHGDSFGRIGDIVVAVIGSTTSGWLFVALGIAACSLIAAFVGAFALIVFIRGIRRHLIPALPPALGRPRSMPTSTSSTLPDRADVLDQSDHRIQLAKIF